MKTKKLVNPLVGVSLRDGVVSLSFFELDPNVVVNSVYTTVELDDSDVRSLHEKLGHLLANPVSKNQVNTWGAETECARPLPESHQTVHSDDVLLQNVAAEIAVSSAIDNDVQKNQKEIDEKKRQLKSSPIGVGMGFFSDFDGQTVIKEIFESLSSLDGPLGYFGSPKKKGERAYGKAAAPK